MNVECIFCGQPLTDDFCPCLTATVPDATQLIKVDLPHPIKAVVPKYNSHAIIVAAVLFLSLALVPLTLFLVAKVGPKNVGTKKTLEVIPTESQPVEILQPKLATAPFPHEKIVTVDRREIKPKFIWAGTNRGQVIVAGESLTSYYQVTHVEGNDVTYRLILPGTVEKPVASPFPGSETIRITTSKEAIYKDMEGVSQIHAQRVKPLELNLWNPTK